MLEEKKMSVLLQIRKGEYGIYNNKLYRILSFNSNADMLTLCSTDENDLNNGFTRNESESIINMYGFISTKEVQRKEIIKAYRISTHAKYKGYAFDIIGGKNDAKFLTLSTHNRISNDPVGEELFLRESLINIGFQKGHTDIDGSWYEKEVPIDDPDLELVENSGEIDVTEL